MLVTSESAIPKALDLWWRIQDFSVETRSGNSSELTDANVDALKEPPVVDSLGSYELQIPAGTKLPAHSYLGMNLTVSIKSRASSSESRLTLLLL